MFLDESERAVHRALHVSGRGDSAWRLTGQLLCIGQARVALHEAACERKVVTVAGVSRVLDRLRSAASPAELFRRTAVEVGGLGYDRCLVSRVRNRRWIAVAGYVRDDPEQASQMTAVSRRSARLLDRNLVESEMMRRRRPIIVPRAQENARVHPELRALTAVDSYAGAPLILNDSVLGFLHADSTASGRTVDPSDADVLGLLAGGLGVALERAILYDRILGISRTLDGSSAVLTDIVGELVDTMIEDSPDQSGTRPDSIKSAVPPRLDRLSIRENEVLECMAEGYRNATIAMRLSVAESTVKTHVRHILRKLGANNRAQAVGCYLSAAAAREH